MAAKNKFMNAMKMPAIADMFSSEADRQRESGDLVTEVPLSELHPFVNHPFEVRDDEDMQKLVDSIKENGVLTNLTVRPRAEGGYEIISGHRRFHAAQLAGLDKIKVQVRDVDDDQAIIDMVDANIQREHISPMEKARAYAMKLEAMGYTYELTEGTTTRRLAAALNPNSLLLHPFRLSADAFSLGCGIAAALMAGLIYLCVKYSKHRLMPQKEYGSARWGGPEDIAPFLDENAQNNLPLTASESLSLSPKMKVTANDNYNRNKNVIVFGPSGSGKSYSVAGPQLLQFNSNYVLSDPKGELLQEYGNVLLSQGYKVKVFNLKDRDKSDHYNLFTYIKNEDDILVVTKNLVKNLKEDPTAKSTADPIWEEGMTALLEALIGYVFYELEPEERNMNSVMTLLLMLESQEDGPNSVSQLDLLFDDLSINKPNSFAAKQYKLYKMAPGKTAQSINVSLGLRMSAFNIPSIANICADDTIDLRELGSEKKVALFVVTPDTTTAYNFLAAVMFQQCFQILVDIADHRPDKRLPRHLRFLLDEFPNIGMIPDFQILISTIRSRDIACTLIYQSLNQLKSQYKDDWATIYENCDSMIVLGAGGNPENLEFFSKALGKATIEVMNTSENKGSQGSYTKSYQALGRELMTPEEIRTMPRNWCLLMISGVAPFYSRKYNLKDHPNYHLVEAEGGKPFDYDRRAEQSFADFISNVKDVKTVKLCAENNN